MSFGSQLAISHEHAWPICNALAERGIITDFRAPDILRFGLSPLYNRYIDTVKASTTLQNILETELWRDKSYQKQRPVT